MSTVVHCTTTTTKEGVSYEVFVGGNRRWERFVAFGKKRSHRAGGSAFREAAQEQEREAGRLLLKENP